MGIKDSSNPSPTISLPDTVESATDERRRLIKEKESLMKTLEINQRVNENLMALRDSLIASHKIKSNLKKYGIGTSSAGAGTGAKKK